MEGSFQFEDLEIAYQLEGNGKPVVFLHGWPTNRLLWEKQSVFLKSDCKVLTFDWPGYGQSSVSENYPYTFTYKKEILSALLDHVFTTNEKISIIGHDMGGPPAVLHAFENQESIDQLILLNTVAYTLSTVMDKLSHFAFPKPGIKNLLMNSSGLKTVMRSLSRNFSLKNWKQISSIIDHHENSSIENRLNGIVQMMNNGRKNELTDLAEKFNSLACNKHLIVAKKDQLCYAHMKKLMFENTKVPVHHIEKSGHFISIDQPEQLNRVLKMILKTA